MLLFRSKTEDQDTGHSEKHVTVSMCGVSLTFQDKEAYDT
jgi:hypothetical protein